MVLGVESNYVTHENKQFYPCARNQFFITAIQNSISFSSSSLETKSKQKFMFIRFLNLAKFLKNYVYHWNASVWQWELHRILLILFFAIIFEHSRKFLLCESFNVSPPLLEQVGGFRGEAYYKCNRLYNFRGEKITDCYTNITHKISSLF